jgi:hypothetical protein
MGQEEHSKGRRERKTISGKYGNEREWTGKGKKKHEEQGGIKTTQSKLNRKKGESSQKVGEEAKGKKRQLGGRRKPRGQEVDKLGVCRGD